MITHLPETWKIQNKVTYSSTIYCDYFFSVDMLGFSVGVSISNSQKSILWPTDAKNWLFGKDPDSVKDWRQETSRTTDDEMVGWHYQLNAHEFEQALGVGDGQGGLACCSPQSHKESDTIEQLNWKINRMNIQRSRRILSTWKALWTDSV